MENRNINFSNLLSQSTEAYATINGSAEYDSINGEVRFYNTPYGVMVVASVGGLPAINGSCNGKFFGFHIHNGESCSGNATDPFANAGTHYNPSNCPHPQHAGDLPPLFSTKGFAFSAFLTDAFTIDEIIGKAIIIHDSVDDFTSQPSGNAGNKIACGIIR